MTRRSSVRARRGVSLHLEPHPPRVNFIIVRALFEDRVNFARACSAGSIQGREEIKEIRYLM